MSNVEKISYNELKKIFYQHESNRPKEHLTAHVVFTKDSFTEDYSEESRTYVISSDNKAFQPNMGGYSIFGSCLDGTDQCLRVSNYMKAEHGGENGWVVDYCYLV